MTQPMTTLRDRFEAKVDRSPSCWHWRGFIDKAGYGRLRIGGRTTPVGYAHRISYELFVGPVPEGMELDHLCRNRDCVNPDHLEAVTHATNVRRGNASKPKAERITEITEDQFKRQVIELARTLGWRVAHFRPARTSHGWRTPVEADGAGFPDLLLVRDRVVFLELKREKTRPTPDQVEWLRALVKAGAEAYIARPSDLTRVAEILAARTYTDAAWELERQTREEIAA